MIELRGVVKRYGEHAAVDGVDLACPRGRTVALIGPSGCGKSTLLRMMIGLVEPDAGQITFDDEQLVASRLADVRRRIGYVIQEGGLFPHLTARENATLMPRYLGWKPEAAATRLASLIDLAHLTESLLDRYPRQLSGGQRQRVSLMRALMLDPDVLLLDEPLGALDPMIRVELQEELREIFRSLGKTVVLVTHDLAEAAYLADHIVLLRNGRIEQQGTLPELAQRPASDFVTKFVRAQRQLAS